MKHGTIGYYILYGTLWLLAWLPLPCLYLFSDIISFFLHYIIRYRVKVVRQNIEESFPEKNLKEKRKIENEFYHHLCDYYIETIHLIHAKEDWIKKHFQINNLELLDRLKKDGKDIIALFGHYCNWELASTFPFFVKDMAIGTLYKPLKSKSFDKLFQQLRSQFGVKAIAKNNALRTIITYKREQQPFIMAFIADQSPRLINAKYWSHFLNHNTAFLNGWETIAIKTNCAVVYFKIRCLKRGYYIGDLSLIDDGNKERKEFDMLEQFIRKIEDDILENPSYWLWSHKRWKLKHEIL